MYILQKIYLLNESCVSLPLNRNQVLDFAMYLMAIIFFFNVGRPTANQQISLEKKIIYMLMAIIEIYSQDFGK